MGIFDKLRGKSGFDVKSQQQLEEKGFKKLSKEDYYVAEPRFSKGPDGVFAACCLTEGTLTLLHKVMNYEYDGVKVNKYRLVIASTTRDGIIGDLDYFSAIKELEKNALSVSENHILVNLDLNQLEELIQNVGK